MFNSLLLSLALLSSNFVVTYDAGYDLVAKGMKMTVMKKSALASGKISYSKALNHVLAVVEDSDPRFRKDVTEFVNEDGVLRYKNAEDACSCEECECTPESNCGCGGTVSKRVVEQPVQVQFFGGSYCPSCSRGR